MNDDELKLWQEAISDVTPQGEKKQPRPQSISTPKEQPFSHHKEQQKAKSTKTNKQTGISHSLPKLIANDMRGLDKKVCARIKNKNFDAIIDFHGMTVDEARDRFHHAIVNRGENRLFLFITGQGGRGDADEGFVLKGKIVNAFADWVNGKNARAHLLAFGKVNQGAFYVYTRKKT